MTEKSAADTLYGGSTPPSPADQQQQQSQSTTQQQRASSPPPKSGEQADTEESADKGDTLYGNDDNALRSTYEPTMRKSLDALADLGGATPEQRQQMAANISEIASDARLAPETAASLHALFVQHVQDGGVDDGTLNDWTRQSRAELRERYGDSANARLEAAQAFVRARPDLAKILRETGLGSNPAVIRALTENIHQARMTPRTRKK